MIRDGKHEGAWRLGVRQVWRHHAALKGLSQTLGGDEAEALLRELVELGPSRESYGFAGS